MPPSRSLTCGKGVIEITQRNAQSLKYSRLCARGKSQKICSQISEMVDPVLIAYGRCTVYIERRSAVTDRRTIIIIIIILTSDDILGEPERAISLDII